MPSAPLQLLKDNVTFVHKLPERKAIVKIEATGQEGLDLATYPVVRDRKADLLTTFHKHNMCSLLV